MVNYNIFKTPFGWCGVIGNNKGIKRLILPCKKKSQVLGRIHRDYPEAIKGSSGLGKANKLIRDYFAGKRTRFDFPIDLNGCTDFERKVYKALCKVPYGTIMTYGRLARAIGKPHAARAVGNAMASNPLPLIIPCHRVIRGNGSIGNFSADGGVAFKKRLLDLEARLTGCPVGQAINK